MKITKMNNPKKITDKSGQALKGELVVHNVEIVQKRGLIKY